MHSLQKNNIYYSTELQFCRRFLPQKRQKRRREQAPALQYFMNFVLLLKDEELAGNVVENHHQNTGKELPDVAVPAEDVHHDENDQGFQHTGANAAADEFGQFRNDSLHGPVVAAEDKGLVGQVSKGNGCHPGNGIGCGSRHAHDVVQGQIDDVIDNSSQDTKDKISKNIPVFFNQSSDFLNHTDSLPGNISNFRTYYTM